MSLVTDATSLGLPVFPCGMNKKPSISKDDGGAGFLDATADPADIERLFTHPNAALIGMPTGSRTGIDVLDLDYRHGAGDWETANTHRIPETRAHKTQNGGRHLVFRHVVGVRNSASVIAPGVDVRGEGGYIIVPPSKGYSIISDADIADWPDWLLTLALPKVRQEIQRPSSEPRQPVSTARIERIISRTLDKVRSAPDGQKHFTLRNQALLLGGIQHESGFSDREAVQWLLDALPSSAKDRRAAEKTAEWGIEVGKMSPIDLEDQPRLRLISNAEPPPSENDPGYWAAVESQGAMSEAEWRGLEQRESGRSIPASEGAKNAAGANLLWTITEGWIDGDIEPRRWIAKGYLMRGAVTVVSGPGSAGKSSLMIGWACALSLGCAFHRFHPIGPVRVATYNVEDDAAEQKRRFSALAMELGVPVVQIMERAAIVGPAGVGTLLRMDSAGRLLVNTPVMDELETWVAAWNPDVLILDPFVELHAEEENDNTAVRAVMARFRAMAKGNDMALVILHHSRKGLASPGDPDSLRGASSIVGAARVAITLNVMTDEEAGASNIPADRRRDYFRVDGAKSNYAAIEEAEWFERRVQTLANSDQVALAWPWKPPDVWKELSPSIVNRIMDRIGAGRAGVPFSAFKRGANNIRWAGFVVIEETQISEEQAKRVIAEWLRTGMLFETEYMDKAEGKARKGLAVNDTKRPT